MNIRYSNINGTHQIAMNINGKDYTFVVCETKQEVLQQTPQVAPQVAPTTINKRKRSPQVRSSTRRAKILLTLDRNRSYTKSQICQLIGMKPTCWNTFRKCNPDLFIKQGIRKSANYRLA